ncbi:hypothetical protein C1645_532020 [Glomus cerebriforme]|uniref:Uncharacterized protein n=1 Tax=Glomus cerebriforme TaxID=658196 RepID=A0A397S8Z0_9GLOM|nr:hypothetical protein C1645_532020 [Glomus cerebriforme]
MNHGKRYPSPVNFDANQRNPERRYLLGNRTRTVFANCVSPNDIWLGHNVKWCNLAQSNLMFAENSIHEMQKNLHHSGLLGGADSETPKSTQSRLSSLRSQLDSTRSTGSARTTNEQNRFSAGINNVDNQSNAGQSSFSNLSMRSSGPSLSSFAQLSVKQSTTISTSQPSSSIELNSQAPSLSYLAQKSLQSSGRVSLIKLASKKLVNKSSLQETMTPIISKQSKTLTPSDTSCFRDSTSPTLSSLNEMIKQESRPITNYQTSETTQPLAENNKLIQNSYYNIQLLSNPLIALPSIFAISIFEQLQDNLVPSNDLITFELYTTGSNNNGFAFNEPSPDDIALKAQSQRGIGTPKGI